MSSDHSGRPRRDQRRKRPHLDDPAEREWLTNLDPAAVLANAHRFYSFMGDAGLPADSFLRELAFTKASDALDIDYEVFYQAWLNGSAATD